MRKDYFIEILKILKMKEVERIKKLFSQSLLEIMIQTMNQILKNLQK